MFERSGGEERGLLNETILSIDRKAWLGIRRGTPSPPESPLPLTQPPPQYHPISHSGSNLTAAGGIGYTIVDALDSLLVLGLESEYERARDWVRDHLDFERDADFNTFEVGRLGRPSLPWPDETARPQTTIRILGGLLSAHYLSSQHAKYSQTDPEMYLAHAIDLADRLLATFDSPSGIPWSLVNLGQRKGVPDRDNNRMASLAEAGTMSLEMKYLSHLTGDATYWQAVEKVAQIFNKETTVEGIASIFISCVQMT